MNPIKKYECQICYSKHESESDARDCCENFREVWLCPCCGLPDYDKERAEQCCNSESDGGL